jgi:aromatic ring-opening dioxygenase catalytic subunit (LigB family)
MNPRVPWGSADWAERVRELLASAGWPARSDPERGFDHGAVSMLKPMYPEANMPIVQLSLKATFDPAEHLAAGQALAPLRDAGVLIVGSGLSYHNLREFHAGSRGAQASATFDAWLRGALLQRDAQRRREALAERLSGRGTSVLLVERCRFRQSQYVSNATD